MVKNILHKIYLLIGKSLTNIRLLFWKLRDKMLPPKETAILFVSHPDDDTLFFHTFIKEQKPYVLLTTGWSLRRYPCFKKVMKYYGVKYRAYNLDSREKNFNLIKKHIKDVFTIVKPNICATHNSEGEYGHEMHINVHNAVKEIVDCELFVPAFDSEIDNYPLTDDFIKEKTMIFQKYYTTESFVLDQYEKWVKNEMLIREK